MEEKITRSFFLLYIDYRNTDSSKAEKLIAKVEELLNSDSSTFIRSDLSWQQDEDVTLEG